MKKIGTIFIIILFLSGSCLAQIYISPVVGYQADLNNKDRFKQINTGLQLSFKTKKRYELILKVERNSPLAVESRDSAFTSDPSLPVFSNAGKKILPAAFSVSIGHRIMLNNIQSKNIFSLILFSGIAWQNIEVTYQYQTNYIILNPDQTQTRAGIFLKGGMEYMRVFKSGRVFVQVAASTPPIAAKQINYPSSFRLMAPLSFDVGYSIAIKKNGHAKK